MKKIFAHFTDFNHTKERQKKNTFGALGYYRTFKPAKQIKNFEVDIVGADVTKYGTTFETLWQNVFKKHDIVWIMHYLNEHNASAQAFFKEKTGKKLVYDIDDNYLDVPESNPVSKEFAPTKRNRAILSTMFYFADALTVSTEPLKDRLQAHFRAVHQQEKPIFVIPNMNDVKDWAFTPAKKDQERIVIGYSGSNSHQEDLLLVLPVIDKLMKKYPNLWLEVMGAIDKSKLDIYFRNFTKAHLDRVAMTAVTPTFWEYPQYLAEQKWNIGIAPLVDSSFTRCKSHIKWMEYSMYKIPTVASRVYPYFMDIGERHTIEDGQTGYLCRTTKEWEEKLTKLIESEELRNKIGENAYEYVKKAWQYDDFSVDNVFEEILKL